MSDAVRVVTCTADELRLLVREAVRAELGDAQAPSTAADVYTTAEAAAYLRFSKSALLFHIRQGHIKPDTFGRRGRTAGHRFRRETLDAFLGDRKNADSREEEQPEKSRRPRPRW